MLFGRISRRWASRHAPAWLDEVDHEAESTETLVSVAPGAGPPEDDVPA
jgi:cytochrome b subunit of formate dehydrogenase